MANLQADCDKVIRAAYQISGCTGAPVSLDQIRDIVPLPADDLRKILLALQSRGLIPANLAPDSVALTPAGLQYAAALPPISEPPLFEDI